MAISISWIIYWPIFSLLHQAIFSFEFQRQNVEPEEKINKEKELNEEDEEDEENGHDHEHEEEHDEEEHDEEMKGFDNA